MNRKQAAERTRARLKNFSLRLAAVGGELQATGLRTTEWRFCCTETECPRCRGSGTVKVINDGKGTAN